MKFGLFYELVHTLLTIHVFGVICLIHKVAWLGAQSIWMDWYMCPEGSSLEPLLVDIISTGSSGGAQSGFVGCIDVPLYPMSIDPQMCKLGDHKNTANHIRRGIEYVSGAIQGSCDVSSEYICI